MIRVELQNVPNLLAAFQRMPDAIVQALAKKIRVLTLDLANYIRTQKLQGQVLNQRSGNLNRSIQESTTTDGSIVTGKAFSAGDVKYARIHEYGGTIPAHDIVAKGNALAFMIGNKLIFAKSVHIPAVAMPERSFMRSSLMENKDKIVQGTRDAALLAARKVFNK